MYNVMGTLYTLSTYDRMAKTLLIAIRVPFPPIFRDFDTLFAIRAFSAHP